MMPISMEKLRTALVYCFLWLMAFLSIFPFLWLLLRASLERNDITKRKKTMSKA